MLPGLYGEGDILPTGELQQGREGHAIFDRLRRALYTRPADARSQASGSTRAQGSGSARK